MSIVDMSSPDPLQSLEGSVIPSSTRRMTRSVTRGQGPSQFFSLASASSIASPRKRTFELDVGNEQSPQRIRVTVEAEPSSRRGSVRGSARTSTLGSARGNVSRRLFQELQADPTPTARRTVRPRASAATASTTTIVPLRGLTDDEGAGEDNGATPKKRGRRPRVSTPAAAITRKRQGTPMRRSTKRTKQGQDDLASELSVADDQATPRARKQSPAKRTQATPAADSAQPKKRGRPRKIVVPEPEGAPVNRESSIDAGVEDNGSLPPIENDPSVAADGEVGADYVGPVAESISVALSDRSDAGEEDIWLADAAQENGSPVATITEQPYEADLASDANAVVAEVEPVIQAAELDSLASDGDDAPGDLFMDLADADPRSPESYVSSEALPRSETDTVAAGEGFTMISVGSLPSMLKSSMMGPQQPLEEEEELGEATSLIISQTLESLRRSQQQAQAQVDQEPLTSSQEDQQPAPTVEQPEPTQSRPFGSSLYSHPRSPKTLLRSPRRGKSRTPLGRQLALKSLQNRDLSRSPSPQKTAPVVPSSEVGDETAQYNDSFSEIPEAVLNAATPRPPRQTLIDLTSAKEDDEEDEELEHEELENGELELDEPEHDDEASELKTQGGGNAVGLVDMPLSERSNATVNPPSHPQSETNRLLTPDKTSSTVVSELGEASKSGLEDKSDQQAEITHENNFDEGTDEALAEENLAEDEDNGYGEAAEYEPASEQESEAEPELMSSPPVIHVQGQARKPSPLFNFRGHSRNRSLETPIEPVVSTMSPKGTFTNFPSQRANLAVPEVSSRRTLSPIMRAGRALQMITSDPPSPPRQEAVLRSPFRGSVSLGSTESPALQTTLHTTRQTKSPSPPPAPVSALKTGQVHAPAASAPPSARQTAASPWARALAPFNKIKSLAVQGAQALTSPRVAASQEPKAAPEMSQIPDMAPVAAYAYVSEARRGPTAHPSMEDPFVSSSSGEFKADALKHSMFTQSKRSARATRDRSSSVASSTGADVPSNTGGDEMSWVADDSAPAPRIEMIDAQPSARSSVAASGASNREASEEMDEDMEEDVQQEPAWDDYGGQEWDGTDGEYETENEAAVDKGPAQETAREEAQEDEDEDIWAFEASRPTPRSVNRHGRSFMTDDGEGFSMLSRHSQNDSKMGDGAKELADAANAKKADLSAFFSSPAALPEMQPFGISKPFESKVNQVERPVRKYTQPSGLFRNLAGNRTESRESAQSGGSQAFGFSALMRENRPPSSRRSPSQPTEASSPAPAMAETDRYGPAARHEPNGLPRQKRTTDTEVEQENPQPIKAALPFDPFGPVGDLNRPSAVTNAFKSVLQAKAQQSTGTNGVQAQMLHTANASAPLQPISAQRPQDNRADQNGQGSAPLGVTKPSFVQQSRPSFQPRNGPEQVRQARHVPQKGFQIIGQRAVDLFTPSSSNAREASQDSLASQGARPSSSIAPEEQSQVTNLPQKQNFVPHQRPATNAGLFAPRPTNSRASFFGVPAPAVQPAANPSVEAWAEDVSMADEVSMDMTEEQDDSSFLTPELKPLPDRAASPSKSCIRSPLKGKTPGRVVEFTSSTQSPLEELEDEDELWEQPQPRTNASVQMPSLGFIPALAPPTYQRQTGVVNGTDEDKENQTSDSEKDWDQEPEPYQRPAREAKPLASTNQALAAQLAVFGNTFHPEPPKPTLSHTEWTRAHWLRLDELLQERRQISGEAFIHKHGAVASAPARRPSRRFLGKQVTSAIENMVLEQWHLDVCDVFQAEVGGWDESVLVRRVFALIVGEERRKKGLVPNIRNGKRVFF